MCYTPEDEDELRDDDPYEDADYHWPPEPSKSWLEPDDDEPWNSQDHRDDGVDFSPDQD